MFNVKVLLLLYIGSASDACLKPHPGSTNPSPHIWAFPCHTKFEPSWEALESRSSPKWYDEAKVGILVHLGVYSVPAYASEWFWWFWQGKEAPVDPTVEQYVRARYPASWTYADFARDFTCEFFDPMQWANLFRDAGAKYVVFTAKHHEGFTLWPSDYSFNWNAMQIGPKRDLVNDLSKAVRHNGLKFGVYYSLYEWFHPLWLEDKKNGFTTFEFSRQKVQVELRDLVVRYNPDIIWADGDFAPDTYWNSTYFLAWLYSEKEQVVVNDRWGYGTSCRNGDFHTCGNKFNPGQKYAHKFENVFSLDSVSWGYRRTLDVHCVKTIEEILFEVVSTIACNGNVLISIGARADGTIPTIFEERLRQMGEWLKLNSEAVHGSKTWDTARDVHSKDIWYTSKPSCIYAFMTKWPVEQSDELTVIILGSVNRSTAPRISNVVMLSKTPIPLKHAYTSAGLTIELPCFSLETTAKWVWVIKIIQ